MPSAQADPPSPSSVPHGGDPDTGPPGRVPAERRDADGDGFRSVFDHLPHPAWVHDARTGRILAANAAAAAQYGRSPSGLEGTDLRDLDPAAGPADTPADGTLRRHRLGDGGTHEVAITVRPLRFAARDARLVMVQDVTERLRAERLLRDGEATLRSFYDSVPMMMGLVEVTADDTDVVHLVDNPATEAFFGMATGSTRGRTASAMGASAEAIAEWVGRYREAQRRGTPVRFEYRHRGPERDVWLSSVVSHVGTGESGRDRFSYVTENVSERRRAMDLLRHSEERLGLALQSGQLGFFDVHLPTGVAHYGGCWASLLGLETDEVEPHIEAWRSRVHPDDLPLAEAALADHVAGRTRHYECEHRVRHRDGGWRWLLGRGRVVRRDADGAAVRLIGVNTDVTARRQAEDALKAADERKDRFLATLAHELRNPLAPVRSAVEVLRRAGDAGQRGRALDIMDRQVGHMVRLIDDLMDVSRITHGKVVLAREDTTLQAVVTQAIESAQPVIAASGHTVSVTRPGETLRVHGDPVRLTQVVTNLLTNAAKYTPRGSAIAVSIAREGSDGVAAVSDQGIGIAADDLERVFEMFAQVGRADDRRGGGLGIGLALARAIVDLHGGRIEAASEGLGRGSTFRVRLPLTAEAPASDSDAARASAPVHRPLRVLVADDNEDAAGTLAMLLQLQGHEVRTVPDGRRAIDEALAWRPDVALLDLGMPGVDGFGVARALRAAPEAAGMRLVALTGWGQEEDRRRTRDAGFDVHLVKPADDTELDALLDRFARERDAAGR